MSILGVNDMLAAYQYANKAQKNNATGKTSFADTVKQTAENSSASREEQYVEYLKQRYGANVMVKNIGNDQRSIDNFGASIAGYNNIVIAPNILEEMANNPEKAAHYEKIIQKGLDDIPRCKAEMSMNGFEMSSYAVSIDEKGVGYVYVTGDLKPEVRAKIEAKVRAEQAAKRARRVRYQELAEEAQSRPCPLVVSPGISCFTSNFITLVQLSDISQHITAVCTNRTFISHCRRRHL